jgi:SAM-dependent methyltransferase
MDEAAVRRLGSRRRNGKDKPIGIRPVRNLFHRGLPIMQVAAGKSSALRDIYWRTVVSIRYITCRFGKLPQRFPRECNICGYNGYFGPAEGGRRIDARCPRCKSVERYRLIKLWLDRYGDVVRGSDVLHFAPEKSLKILIKPIAKTYCTADIQAGRADIVLDIEAMDLPDAAFDCVFCLHVLEHVDDKRALAEIYRVLRPGGFAIIMIPMAEGLARTYEDATVISGDQRTLHFGQRDHVRYYGADIRERVLAAGFTLSEFSAEGPELVRHRLTPGEKGVRRRQAQIYVLNR